MTTHQLGNWSARPENLLKSNLSAVLALREFLVQWSQTDGSRNVAPANLVWFLRKFFSRNIFSFSVFNKQLTDLDQVDVRPVEKSISMITQSSRVLWRLSGLREKLNESNLANQHVPQFHTKAGPKIVALSRTLYFLVQRQTNSCNTLFFT